MKKEMEEEIRAQLQANMENMMSWDEKVITVTETSTAATVMMILDDDDDDGNDSSADKCIWMYILHTLDIGF